MFFFEDRVLALDTEELTVRGELRDRAQRMPLGFDGGDAGPRLWLLRENSTAEAWDAGVTKPVSWHRLKGQYVGCHRDGEGRLCVSSWDEKKKIFRIYRLR